MISTQPARPRLISSGRIRVPRTLAREWRWALLSVDVLGVLGVSLFAGVSPFCALAVAMLVVAALAACGGYTVSYAVRPRDEAYHAATGILLASLPAFALLALAGYRDWRTTALIVCGTLVVLSAERILLHVLREREGHLYGGIDAITATAQWKSEFAPGAAVKRAMDVALAAIAVVLLAPLMLATAVAIAIDSGTPVIFIQERVGRHGTPFRLFKFRTMKRNAGSSWAKTADPRITRIGAFLRRTSLDEFPQLFNVLRGDMSLVGPRPEMTEYARRFDAEIPEYAMRHIVRPGVTGWAQVQMKRNLDPSDAPEVLAHDLFYVENASPWLDVIVILKTASEFLLHRAV